MTNRKICFFNRISIHYRKNIYMLMDKELPCDFYFGDSRPGKIAPLDVAVLSNYKGKFHNVTFGPFYWQRGALKLLKSDYTDIITPGDIYCISTWLMIFLSSFYNKNLYFWAHGAYGDESRLRAWLQRFRYTHIKGAFLYGNYAKDILVKYGVPSNKLHVVYNSLDYDEQAPMRSKMKPSEIYKSHFGNVEKNIVFIGRLTKVKKLDQIITALTVLKKQGCNYNLTFIGDGTERLQLEKKAAECGLVEKVWFYGPCYDESKISEFLYNADVCVSPGNVGLTAMHSMTFGTPVITHSDFSQQMPEVEAIEEGKTGTFFERDNTEDLAKAIKRWLSSDYDRESIRRACYKVMDEKYNPHIQVETMKKAIYNK